MNYLAMDWGRKIIGLAHGRVEARLATPLPSLVNDSGLLKNLKALISEQAIEALVVGLPRNLNGQQTTQTREVKKFAKTLAQKLKLPLHVQDETLTTQQALSATQSDKFDVHSQAATIILQDFFDERAGN